MVYSGAISFYPSRIPLYNLYNVWAAGRPTYIYIYRFSTHRKLGASGRSSKCKGVQLLYDLSKTKICVMFRFGEEVPLRVEVTQLSLTKLINR